MALTYWDFATDEHVAIRASADFVTLVPRDNLIAYGADGVFSSGDRWTLTSATCDPSARGVRAGNCVVLTKPTANYKPPGTVFVVSSVASGSMTLRRRGQSASVGEPPGPAAGVTGVEFSVWTFAAEIEDAYDELRRRFGIDDLISGRRSTDMFDSREIRQALVLTVLSRQYMTNARQAGTQADDFFAKAGAYKQELNDVIDRLTVHWKNVAEPAKVTRSFGARLQR